MFSSSRELKLRAKATMRRRLFSILMMAALFIVATYLLSYLSGELDGSNSWSRELMRRVNALTDQIGDSETPDLEAALYGIIDSMPDLSYYSRGVFGTVLAVLISLMSIPLSVGYANHILRESRGEETGVGSLMFGFQVMWKSLVISLLSGLLTALGLILFIVPGVVLLLRYSMAVMVLVDNPELGPIACMKESARLMRGHKWRFFKLAFSFLLWMVASSLVTSLIGAPLLNLYLTPYINLTQAEFYKEIAAPQYAPPYQGPDIY